MGIKLLSVRLTILLLFLLGPLVGFGQCPTSVGISSNDTDNTICKGETIKFTANPADGNGLTYQWQVNGVNVPGATNIDFETNTLSDNDKVRVVVRSTGLTCNTASDFIAVMVNAIPSAPSISGDNDVCAGDNLTLTASAISGATYNWTGPDNFSFSSTSRDLTRTEASTAMSGTYSVTATVNGCTGPAGTYNVSVNAIPGTPSAGNGGDVCPGETINLNASTISGASYSWSGPNGFTSSSQNPSRTGATAAMAGTYKVTATINGCTSAEATTEVTVKAPPAAPTAGNTGAVCVGGTIELTASNITGASYSWNGPNGFTSNVQNPSISGATTVMAGTYNVTATVDGCSSNAATTTVVVNTIPSTPTVSNNGPVCVGGTINLTANTISGATYNWTGPNNFSSNQQNPTITGVTVGMAGDYKLTVAVNGCESSEATTTVVVYDIPSPPTAGNGGPVCVGGTINLTASTIAGASYIWTGPGGFTSNLQNPTRSGATTAMAGNYNVTVTVNGCTSSSSSTTVVVNTIPSAPTAGSNSPVCMNGTINLTANTITGATYSWTGPDGFTSTQQNPAIPNLTAAKAGTYSVTATVNGCTSPAGTTSVTITPNVTPSVSITSTSTSICSTAPSGSTPVTFTATPVNPGTNPVYQWKNGTTNIGTNSPTFTANSLPNGSQISVVITSNATCASPVSATSNVITMTGYTLPAAPVFTASSGNVNVSSGICPPVSGLVYTVADGGANVTSYNWEVPYGWTITGGANTNSITVDVTGASGTGDLSLKASAVNACGTSSQTSFTVNTNKSASVYAGVDKSICKGGSITLEGEKSGYAKDVLWTASTSGGTFSDNKSLTPTYTPPATYTGAITLTLTTTKTTGNPNCPVVADQMVLTVNAPPAISTQPSTNTQLLCPNAAPSQLSVTATGAGLTYQWYSNASNSNIGGTAINGATSATYTPVTTNPGTLYYYVVVSGTCASPVKSNVSGAVTVNAPPAITATGQPSTTPQTLCPNAAANELSVTATGAGLTYQWYSNTTNSNTGGTSLGAGATSSTYTPVTTIAGTLYYYAVVSGTCTPAVTSNVSGAVTVNAPPAITVQPSTTQQTLCLGAAATELTVTATGAGLNYQWYSNTTNSNTGGTSLGAGATSSTYKPVTTTAGTLYYYVVVGGTCSPAVTSEVSGAVTVNALPAIDAQPSTTQQTLCLDAAATELSVTAAGAGLTYQWYSNTTNSNSGGTSLGAGAISSTYTPVTTTAGTLYYYVVVSGTCTPPVTSNVSGAVTVNAPPAITAQPSTTQQTLCLGAAATEFAVTATGAGLTYQWYSNTTNSNSGGTLISGANSASYKPVTTTAGTVYYYVQVSGTCGSPVTSDVSGAVTVNELPAITAQPSIATQALCLEGAATELSVTATGPGLTYQWFSNTTNSNSGGTSINNATASTYTPATATAGTLYYYVVVSGTCTPPVTSKVSGAVTVSEPVVITKNLEYTEPVSVCAGFPVSFEVEATGTGVTYEWFKDNTSTGITSPKLNISQTAASNAGIYKVLIKGTDPCPSVESKSVELIVNQSITINTQPESSIPVCLGESSMSISIDATGDIYDYVWRKDGIPVSDGSKYDGSSTAILTISDLAIEDSGNYDVVISSPEGSCSQIISNPAKVTVYSPPVVDAKEDFEVCSTSTNINIGTGATASNHISLVWTTNNGQGQISNASDLNGATYAPVAADLGQTLTFTLTAKLEVGGVQICGDAVDTRSFKIVPQPVITQFSYISTDNSAVSGEFCETDATTYTPHIAGENLANGSGVFSVDNSALTVNSSTGAITPNGTVPGEYIITYRYTVNSQTAVCTVAEKSFTVKIGEKPIADFSYANTPFCSNAENPLPLMAANAEKGKFTSSAGLVFIDESTGEINIEESTPGTYSITNTIAAADGCAEVIATSPITINQRPGAPGVLDLAYCLNTENVPALTATTENGATLNWYTSQEGGTASTNSPQPNTSTAGTTTYWVSQTSPAGCESERAQITVTVNPLPEVTAEVAEAEICLGSPAVLSATGGVSYIWYDGEEVIGNVASISHTPSAAGNYIFSVLVTDANGCENTAEVNVQVDENTVAGTLTGPGSVCVSSPNGTLTLSGYTGDIQRWEKSEDAGTNWTIINTTSNTYDFTNLATATSFRAVVKSGVCAEIPSNKIDVIIDALPIGGELAFEGTGRIFMTCEGAVQGYAAPLNLTGHTGQVVEWQYHDSVDLQWKIYDSQSPSLTGSEVETLVANKSTVFRAKIINGACTNPVYSKTAIVSVIPSNIEPSPVKVDPVIVCVGSTVSLSSETGYGASIGKFEGGAFDDAAIDNSNTWRFTKNGSVYNFESSTNNTKPAEWLRMNPHPIITANINTNATTEQFWDSSSGNEGNKGFAIVSGNNDSNMETPVFSLGGLDQAVLTFDQAYNLTNGAKIYVEISTDGGSSYSTVLFEMAGPATSGNYASFGDGSPQTRPLNKMVIDLGDYLGQTNLKIRFRYDGYRDGDVWAVDAIKVPEGPQGVLLQWFYDENPEDDEIVQIGQDNQSTVTFPPNGQTWSKIGWNDFAVKTALLLDSNGNACESLNNQKNVKVFVFDQYTTAVEVVVSGCGNLSATLSASVSGAFQGTDLDETETTIDGYKGRWKIVGPEGISYTLKNRDGSTSPDPTYNPNVIFEAENIADFEISWELVLDENLKYPDDFFMEALRGQPITNPGCPPTAIPTPVIFENCTTLDFDGVDDYVDLGTNYAGFEMIEAWIRPFERGGNTNSNIGSVISGPGFDINMQQLSTKVTPNGRWYHIAVLRSGELYVDGIPSGSINISSSQSNRTLIGARWVASTKTTENHFSGWIEEVRIWSNAPTLKEVRFMMNQRLKLASGTVVNPLEGEIVPNRTVPGSYLTANGNNLDQDEDPFYDQTGTDLMAYYRLISEVPDPTLGIISNEHKPVNGNTPDLSSNNNPGRLFNMTTHQENTSPTPYFSNTGGDGLWYASSTWARGTLWAVPASNNTNWNIVRTRMNISSGGENISVLGLISESNLINMIGTNPVSHSGGGSGNKLRVTHYLLLDGNIDLNGESQLLQNHGSILFEPSKGYVERDQQGKRNSFVYNYWSSPVSLQGSTPNNAPYTVKDVLLDGTDPADPKTINFQAAHWAADGARTTPITTSTYWLWGFSPADANVYAEWDHIRETGTLKTGEGFTMKGTDGTVEGVEFSQNYTFKGKPHNGNITTDPSFGAYDNYLIGNPYPSAIDSQEFMLDNLKDVSGQPTRNTTNVFDGALYFWDHIEELNHILKEYVGGYAVRNFLDAVPAVSVDERINPTNAKSGKLPGRYIPVGQAFLINSTEPDGSITISGGEINFKNSQRAFKKDGEDGTLFLKPEIVTKESKDFPKIRLSFSSPVGYYRQILVGAVPHTTNGFDLGYDAPMMDNNIEDMYWLQGNNQLVIQGVPNFDQDQVLPLGIKVQEEKEFRIKIDTVENSFNDLNIYIKDKLKDTIHDLRKTAYFSTSEPGHIDDRFELVFFKAPIPIEPGPGGGKEEPEIEVTELTLRHSHVKRQIQILNPDQTPLSNLYVFDMNGKLVNDYKNLSHEKAVYLPVKSYSSGVYIIKLYHDNGVITQKIIINNQ